MKRYLLTLFQSLFFAFCCLIGSSCTNNSKQVKVENHKVLYKYDYNLLIAPDLSNRIVGSIYPKPIHDTTLILGLLDRIETEFLGINNRKLGQRDVYKLDFINKGILNKHVINSKNTEINLRTVGSNTADHSAYIRNHLDTDVSKFKNEVQSVYRYSENHLAGSDIWNYFNETIHTSLIQIPDATVPNTGEHKVVRKNENIVVLLTDGYIENKNKQAGYVLDQTLIAKIRKEFLASGSKDLKQFIVANRDYQLMKTSKNLHGLHVIVMEVMDRSLDAQGVAKVQPTDFQILQIVWEIWLKDSGAKKVEIHQAVDNSTQFFKILSSFMNAI